MRMTGAPVTEEDKRGREREARRFIVLDEEFNSLYAYLVDGDLSLRIRRLGADAPGSGAG